MKGLNFSLSLVIDNVVDITDEGDMNIVKKRLDQIKKHGFDGVVLTFGNFGDGFLSALGKLISDCAEKELSVWLGFSGPRSGEAAAPAVGSCRLALGNDGEVMKVSDLSRPSPFYEVCAYETIGGVYERVKAGLSSEAFEYITGFCAKFPGFSDLSGSTVPWYDEIEEEFKNDYGMEAEPFLKELFSEGEPSKFKDRYWRRITARFRDASLKPVAQWCLSHGKKLFMASDTALSPINMIEERGSYLESEGCGGALMPSITVKTPGDVSVFSASMASGLARQQGGGEAAASVFGGTGWGLSPEDFEECLRKLMECGISTFVINSCYPRLNYEAISARRISFPTHVPWSAVIPDIFKKLRHLAEIEQKRAHRILVVCPTRAIQRCYTPGGENGEAMRLSEAVTGICDRLFEMSRRFDVTDENLFERCAAFDGSGVSMGEKSYGTLLVTPGCAFNKKGRLNAEKAKAGGTRILHDIPKSDTEIIPLELIRNTLKEIVPVVVNQDKWTITLPEDNVLPLTPAAGGGKAEFAFNASEDYAEKTTLLVTDPCGNVSINDILVSRGAADERGAYYDITSNIVSGENKIVVDNCQNTFAFLLGGFKVVPSFGWRSFDSRQVQTRDSFFIRPQGIESETNLVRCGYPFADKQASAKKIIYIEENINRPILKIDCGGSSLIAVYFDNEFLGYVYGESNTLPVPPMAADERHLVEIRCCPPGFNLYGDKKFIFGDTGRTENPSAPNYRADENVKAAVWKIPREIELIREF